MLNPPRPAPLSAPFAAREFDGEGLLAEIQHLREAQVGQKHLNDCAAALRPLLDRNPIEGMQHIKQLATARFQTQPELARLLVLWAAKVKSPRDFQAVCMHFQRLALTSSLVGAIHRGAARLPSAGKRR
jgi:hypothetical protein